MKNQNERNHPPKPAAEDDAADAAELAKLTKEFTAALTRLSPPPSEPRSAENTPSYD